MVRLRKFVTLDGEVLAEEEWEISPIVRCFYCDRHLVKTTQSCPIGFEGYHDYITLVHR
jgi:hypothetical protein